MTSVGASDSHIDVDAGVKSESRCETHDEGRGGRHESEVDQFNYSDCVEPRDRIFSFRGLARDVEYVKVDYEAGLLDMALQYLLKDSLTECDRVLMKRLATEQAYDTNDGPKSITIDTIAPLKRNRIVNTCCLVDCQNMLQCLRVTEADLKGSLDNKRLNVIVLGEFLPASVNEEIMIRLAFDMVAYEEFYLAIDLGLVKGSSRALTVIWYGVRAVDPGLHTPENMPSLLTKHEPPPLLSAFELCRHHDRYSREQHRSSSQGRTSDMRPVHMSRAALLLLGILIHIVRSERAYPDLRSAPPTLMEHFERIERGAAATERLCHCEPDGKTTVQADTLEKPVDIHGALSSTGSSTEADLSGDDGFHDLKVRLIGATYPRWRSALRSGHYMVYSQNMNSRRG